MPLTSSRNAPALLALGALAVLALALPARCGRDAVRVSTARVVRQTISSVITTNGKVEPIDPRIIQAQLTTFVDSVLVKEGQAVSRGQLLLTLDATETRSELARVSQQLVTAQYERATATAGGSPADRAELEAELAKTNAEISRLRREAEVLRRLYGKQAATRDELEQNTVALDKAEADSGAIVEKQAALAQRSRTDLERATFRQDEARNSRRALEQKVRSARVAAPVSGVLYSLPARAGTLVQTGTVLAELADLTRVRARLFVDEPDLGALREGQPVEITWDGLPSRTWTGRVERLPQAIVARGARNVGEVLCSVRNDQAELLPNTNINARVQTARHDNALTVPRSAVRTEGARRYVFAVVEGRVRTREVTLGISNPTEYEVLSGLAEGDVVAIPGSTQLRENQPVTPAGQH